MKHLVLSGSAKDRGHKHGGEWKKDIQAFAALRKDLLFDLLKDWSKEKITKLIEAHLVVLKNDQELWEEFCALSEASGVSKFDLMILNNHTDIRDFAGQTIDEQYLESFFECSCFAIQKASGKIIAGQTWDMHGSARPYVGHLSIQKDVNGQHIQQEVFTLAGCLALTGVSSSGVGVFINNLRSKELSIGYAWPALVRKALNQSSIATASRTIQNFMPSAGRNFLVASQFEAKNIEVSGKRMLPAGDLQHSKENFLIHTNHYLSQIKESEDEATRSQTTLKRYAHVESILKELSLNKSKISNQSLAAALLVNDPLQIVSIPVSATNPHASATCGGVIYDFESQEGLSFAGLYTESETVNFKIS